MRREGRKTAKPPPRRDRDRKSYELSRIERPLRCLRFELFRPSLGIEVDDALEISEQTEI